jgi:hypothetical protein
MEWSQVKSTQLKVLSATAGGAAVLAMGALTVTSSDVSVAETPEPAPPGPVTTSEVTRGDHHRNRGAGGAGDIGGGSADHNDTAGLPADGGTALIRCGV